MSLTKIVSGGQTGVDRGALDAALEAGFPCGGWMPKGRKAEDGPIHDRYPLDELANGGYEERTLQNVLDSDGTAILHAGAIEGGTRQTQVYCVEHRKPCVVVDGFRLTPQEAARKLKALIERHRIGVLNIAGPRASKWPGGHAYARETVKLLLQGVVGKQR